MRAGERERRRFSEILAQDLGDPRLRAMMSMRADFFGDLQKDEPLYSVHRLINVPPLREAQLREVVSRPAALLSARFETPGLAASIVQRAAEESTSALGGTSIANSGVLTMAGVPSSGLPNTMTVRGRMSRPNFLAAAA